MLNSKIIVVPIWLQQKLKSNNDDQNFNLYLDCNYLNSILKPQDFYFYILENLNKSFEYQEFKNIAYLQEWSSIDIPNKYEKEFSQVDRNNEVFYVPVTHSDSVLLLETEINQYANKKYKYYSDLITCLSNIDSFEEIKKTKLFKLYLQLPR